MSLHISERIALCQSFRKAEANKTYTHGHIKHHYLLSRMIFCDHCGNAMLGQANNSKRLYYLHPRGRKDGCDPCFWVRADDIEPTEMVQLYAMYGNKARLEKAMENAMPNPEKVDKLISEKAKLEKRLQSIKRQKSNIVKKIGKEIISDDEAADELKKLRKPQSTLEERLGEIEPQLANTPTAHMIERQATRIKRALHSRINRPGGFEKMTWKEKRELVEFA